MVDCERPVEWSFGRCFLYSVGQLSVNVAGRNAVLGCRTDAFHHKFGGVSEVIAASGLLPLAAFEEVVCVAVDS